MKLKLFKKKFKVIDVERYLNTKSVIKLHVGCGPNYKNDWLNIDNNSDNNISQLDINWDLSKGIPFPDNTIDFIYHEHFIEHLSRDHGMIFFKEVHRVLKSGGVMRIACPDLDELVRHYVNDTWREQEWVAKYHCLWIESNVHMINICMNQHPWGHKYLYNQAEMKSQLMKAGFEADNIHLASFGASHYEPLCGIDTRADSMFLDVSK